MFKKLFNLQHIWGLREKISEGVLRDGYVFKYDMSLPLSSYYKIVEALRERMCDPRITRISGYGHIGTRIMSFITMYVEIYPKFLKFSLFLLSGDGNIHVQLSIPEYIEDIAAQLEPFIFEYVSQHKGSISAEHGIGFKKTKYLHLSRSSSEIEMMHDLKKLMDPNGILNPYKVLQPAISTV